MGHVEDRCSEVQPEYYRKSPKKPGGTRPLAVPRHTINSFTTNDSYCSESSRTRNFLPSENVAANDLGVSISTDFTVCPTKSPNKKLATKDKKN